MEIFLRSFVTVLMVSAVWATEPKFVARKNHVLRGLDSPKAVTFDCPDAVAAFYVPCSCAVDASTDYYITCTNVAAPELIQTAFARTTVRDHQQLEISFDLFSSLPANVISSKRVANLLLTCPDAVTPIGPFNVDAFRSSQDLTNSILIDGCNVQSFSFLTGFSALQELDVYNSAIFNLRDMPALSGLTTIELMNDVNFNQWYFPSLTPNINTVVFSSSLNDQNAANVLEGLIYYADTLEILDLDAGWLTQVPYRLQFLPKLKYLSLSGNPIGVIKSGSLNLPSKLNFLYIAQAGITGIESGAFKGDFSSTDISLSYNNINRFDYGIFYDVVSTMVTGYVEIFTNAVICDCGVSWLIRDCPSLLSHVRFGVCTNGTRFEDLIPSGFTNCPVECVP